MNNEIEKTTFTCRVVELYGRDRDELRRPFGEVLLELRDADGDLFEASIELGVDDYRLAYETYYDGSLVKVDGYIAYTSAGAKIGGQTGFCLAGDRETESEK